MATIYIDGKPHEVDTNRNLLDVCLQLGYNLPYFCWHPAMGSVGACRQCAVIQYKDENDTKGRLIMSCMTPASDGTRISIKAQDAVKFREQIIEWLMTNHPHDCPICDEGGECHLQDMTVMTGHAYRKFRFKKRTYRNQYLGPHINHEMNRCIQCYRCVRFYRDYAGGKDLDVFGAHDHVYFGRHEEGVLESEFSGNLVEICPTGVFTDKTLKQHYTRKWDLTTAPSICVHCGVGCNTIAGERYGEIRRILNRYNKEVNGYFICDRGRFGYEFVNHERRIRVPRINGENTSREDALQRVKEMLAGETKAIGIGSPRASLEANFALRKLVGDNRFYSGFSESDQELITTAWQILKNGPARTPSLNEIEKADAVFVLGEDLLNTAPMMALALRQAVRNKPLSEIPPQARIPMWQDAAIREIVQDETGPLFIATPSSTKLDVDATNTYHAAPDDIARLGFAVAHLINSEAPEVPDLSEKERHLAETIAKGLMNAERPLIISGTSLGSLALLQAAANIASALSVNGKSPALSFTVPESNSMGLSLLESQGLAAASEALKSEGSDTLVILENDLYRRASEKFVKDLFASADNVIVIDHLDNQTTAEADVLLPGASFAEGDGTLVNNEGRAQRFFQVFESPIKEDEIQESWRWLRDITLITEREQTDEWSNLDEITQALASEISVFAPIPEIAPPEGFRIAGSKVPRQPHRYSGRTAMLANVAIHEPKPPDDPDSPLTFTMEGAKMKQPPPALLPRYWAPGWNSVQSLNKFQVEIGGPLKGGDPGRRLIEPAKNGKPAYFKDTPRAFNYREGQWLLVPLYHIFGSEELSALSPGISELSPEPYLALGTDDGAKLQISEGDQVQVSINDVTLTLPVRLHDSLCKGLAGLAVGLADMPNISLPQWGKITT